MFGCSVCGYFSSTLKGHLKHLNLVHSNISNFRVNCGIEGCVKSFSNIGAFKTHISRCHKAYCGHRRDRIVDSASAVKCSLCSYLPSDVRDLVAHLRNHNDYSCPFIYCNSAFHNHASFRSHVARKHKNYGKSDLQKEYTYALQNDEFTVDQSNECEFDNKDYEVSDEECGTNFQDQFCNSFALFLLHIQEECILPVSSVQKIVDNISKFANLANENLSSVVSHILHKAEVEIDTIESVTAAIEEHSALSTSCSLLKTDYLRSKFNKDNFGFVEPETYSLGRNETGKECTYQYISVKESVKWLCSFEDVQEQIRSSVICMEQPANSKLIKDFTDGSSFMTRSALLESPTLNLLLYQDEFEVVNPLGANRKKHKVLAFYFILGNLKVENRSCLQSLQLLLLCKSVDAQMFGLDKILEPFVAEMRDLETEGITVPVIDEKIKCLLVFVCGDNLGSHFLGGYTQCFNRNVTRICRFCLASGMDASKGIFEHKFQKRNRETHKHHLHMIQEDSNNCNLYGVKRDCPLNKLNYFHSSEMLPPDVMHDLLEGIVPSEISVILGEMIKDGLFSVDYLNSRISQVAYGPLDKNDKPQPVPNSLAIKTNAARSWCLLRMLPVLVGHKVPETYQPWELLMLLKDITDIAFAPVLSRRHIGILQTIIQDHHSLYLHLFPDKTLTAKHHFIVHYPRLIEQFGPLLYAWCMRFEAKHFYFKLVSQRLRNYKNHLSMLACRHQMKQCYQRSDKILFKSEVKYVKPVPLDFTCDVSEEIADLCGDCGIQDSTTIQAKAVYLNGIRYEKGMVLIVSVSDTDELKTGKIRMIMNHNTDTFFLLNVYATVYDFHKRMFILTDLEDKILLNFKSLKYYYPLSTYFVQDREVFISKHVLFPVETYTRK